ncbi:MAG: 7-carboxy-7-deazaguanine synthase QueE [Acidimicrobiales bacterium]
MTMRQEAPASAPVTAAQPFGGGEILMSEIFSAIQGEAAFVGHRQVFARLTGCNIRCAYCDQPEALEKKAGPCRVERHPGRRDWLALDSPLPVAEVAEHIDRLWVALAHHSVSLTGGEPLMQSTRLALLVPLLKERGHRLMLETNGTLTAALARVIEWIDYISMDIKLTSVDGQLVDPDTQRTFLAAATQKNVFVKIVLGPSTSRLELADAVGMVHRVKSDVEVFLQPVSPFDAVREAPSAAQVLEWHELALSLHDQVRVIPQTHKMIGQL